MSRARRVLPALGVAGAAAALLWTWDGGTPWRLPAPPSSEAPKPGTPRAAAAPAPDRPLPAGAIRIEESAEGLTVLAREVRRLAVLRALGERFGFEVIASPGRADPHIGVAQVDSDLESVLLAILAEVEHSLRYAPDASGRARLASITLGGERSEPTRARPAPVSHSRTGPGVPYPDAASVAGLEAASGDARTAERERTLRSREEHEREREDQQILALGGGDGDQRARAAAQLDGDSLEAFDALSDALLRDPSSKVRVQAARRIGFADSQRAVPVLGQALRDPDPEVVLEVIDAMVFTQDRTAIEALEQLRTHTDPALRAAAIDAIDTLR